MTSTLPPHVKEMIVNLHRMRLELERNLDTESSLSILSRTGSIRGKSLHVFNTIRRMQDREWHKRDFITEEEGRIVVYITSCAVIRKTWERCRETMDLLKCLDIRTEIRDLNLDGNYVGELIERMNLDESYKDLLFESLPMVYVNGRYFGNDATLFEENEKKTLVVQLKEFKGRDNCSRCAGCGYTVCTKCGGGKKTADRFTLRLRCASCDQNGIAPCIFCSPGRQNGR